MVHAPTEHKPAGSYDSYYFNSTTSSIICVVKQLKWHLHGDINLPHVSINYTNMNSQCALGNNSSCSSNTYLFPD